MCKVCDNERKRTARQALVDRANGRSPVAQADGVAETAEDRAAEIAEHIAECAREMSVKPCDLNWFDFRAYADIAYGENRLGIVRRDITRLGGFNAIRDAYFPKLPTDHGVTRLRLREHANMARRLGSDASAQTFVQQEQERLGESLFKGRIEPVSFPPTNKTTQRAIITLLSDMHYGSNILAEETGQTSYGRVEEARRTARVVQQVCRYKSEHRDETVLHAVWLGDLIHGKLHDTQDGAAKAEQKMRTIHLLSQTAAHYSASYKQVVIHCVGGNHDRDLTRHMGRATSSKWDGIATEIYSSVKMMSSRLTNVTFDIPRTPFLTFEVFGWRYWATHGDTVLEAGNPGKSVNTGRLEAQTNRWNASARDKGEPPFSVFMCGHVHTPLLHHMGSGAWLVVNGALSPVDGYGVSIGLPETVSDQIMFEATPEHPVGDHRFITLDRAVDADASLDAIIAPWAGF